MELFLIRHAHAAKAATGAPPIADAARPLTPHGRDRARRTRRALERLGIRFDHIYHSPKLRSIETADALALPVEVETVVTKRLSQMPTAALLGELSGDVVAVVGHEPHLSALVAMLVEGMEDVRMDWKPAAVVWLSGDVEPGGMLVRAVLPPPVLRALAKR